MDDTLADRTHNETAVKCNCAADIRVHLVLLTFVRIRRINPPYTGHLSRTCVHWMFGGEQS